ncbi:hypothetical protein BDN71DRAFT_1443523 [Pleurotus eryngii]|uniref:Secreted protein n=1 Tax=Pleurotus eryngii TaxID=5323 RepID=A0A9P6A3I2_PLEER|nr:hypothetical protein BDN71DRAFT_1443523 [Pleurotus eryngii]
MALSILAIVALFSPRRSAVFSHIFRPPLRAGPSSERPPFVVLLSARYVTRFWWRYTKKNIGGTAWPHRFICD